MSVLWSRGIKDLGKVHQIFPFALDFLCPTHARMSFPDQRETHAVHAEDSPSSGDATDSELNAPVDISNELAEKRSERSDGKRELKEKDCYQILGYSWPRWKKWTYLAAVAFVQVSMNFNTSVYPAAVKPLSEAFNISEQHARTGQMAYLVTYSIGCELWAPWSEEFGRWPILQLSMFLINIWQILAALAPNWGSMVVARALVVFPLWQANA
ncbi:unnamed protein product [Aspergillus oryzae]|nr:unnamed protein product [Aspergillus oryzae]